VTERAGTIRTIEQPINLGGRICSTIAPRDRTGRGNVDWKRLTG
jgi:hypothetical protein